MTFKPEGYTTVSPYLVVSDAKATMRFLEAVLAGQVLRSFQDPTGRVMHAEVRVGDSIVMLGEASAGWPAVSSHVHVYVKDVDATYALALEQGADAVQVPVKKDDEDKRGGVKDAGGTTWWIATRMA